MKFILGKKLNMTQVFLGDGGVAAVTRIQAGPCVVTAVKSAERHGHAAVQIGFGPQKEHRLTRAERGHLKGLPILKHLMEVRSSGAFERGDRLILDSFKVGDRVAVTGTAKGHGFQGVVKRHHFAGGHASHGHKDQLRMPGSIGAKGVARVLKGRRMGGRMGGQTVTVQNLEIIGVNPETHELMLRGAVPGARNGLILIYGEGEMKVEKGAVAAVGAPVAEATQEVAASEAAQEPTSTDAATTKAR